MKPERARPVGLTRAQAFEKARKMARESGKTAYVLLARDGSGRFFATLGSGKGRSDQGDALVFDVVVPEKAKE